jgi:imidazolonepropionase-like amidohydrolase
MSPQAAIMAATGAAAQRLGTKDIGHIAPGAFADMVVLENDPEKNISSVRNPRAIYLGGAHLNRDTLLTSNPGNWTPTFSFPEPKAVGKKAEKR